LRDALDSILLQLDGADDAGDGRGPWLEVIVVDDGSTDDSAAIAETYPGVQMVRKANGGLASARNAGITAAHGAFVAFLDADDLWLPAKLAKQLALLARHPEADLCLTQVQHVSTLPEAMRAAYDLPDEAPRLGRLMQCLLARRRAFDLVGAFDGSTRTRGDQDWFVRAADAGLVEIVVPEVLTLRRIHGANRSLEIDSKVSDDFLTIAKRTMDRRRQEGGDKGTAWRPPDRGAD
jgi:glycosyltransferase involved in cell wall biosynthesis